jgi:hypothetical protein
MDAAAKAGVNLYEHQAEALALAAISYFNEIVHVRQVADRHLWEADGFQDHLRQRMRHELLDGITRRGLVPVSLPREEVRFMAGGFIDPEGRCEVPEGADWQMAELSLEVKVRRPPVDREAAVKAGVLHG